MDTLYTIKREANCVVVGSFTIEENCYSKSSMLPN